jgi:hypothetical protein
MGVRFKIGDRVRLSRDIEWSKWEEAKQGKTYIVREIGVANMGSVPYAQLEGIQSSYPFNVLEKISTVRGKGLDD